MKFAGLLPVVAGIVGMGEPNSTVARLKAA